MSIAYWCVLAAALMPYLFVGIAKGLGDYDNRNPRAPETYSGIALRADGAHKNAFEAFPIFAVAVLVASGADAHRVLPLLDDLALVWIASRVAYLAAYLADRSTTRSLVWGVGWLVALAMFTMPAWHG